MIRLTRKEVQDVDLTPQGYVKDDDYILLSRDEEARIIFLEALGVESIIIDRLGNEIEPGKKFERTEFEVRLPSVPVKKEMGYYHRLRDH